MFVKIVNVVFEEYLKRDFFLERVFIIDNKVKLFYIFYCFSL